MADTAEEAEKGHIVIGANALLFVTVVGGALLSHLALSKFKKCMYLPESGAAIMLGMFIGVIVLAAASETEAQDILFDPELFFFLILPPIIFEAGFTMQKTNFFKNMTSILLFAVIGTLISTLIVGFGLYALAAAGFFMLNGTNPLECLMFASLISAVDPVATLSILGSKRVNADPVLYSLVFGESVLNDAVSIVLFNTFSGMIGKPYTSSTIPYIFGSFIGVSLGSLFVGVALALACSLLFKKVNFHGHDDYEFVIVFFFAYACYCIAEICHLSGIMALFFCGILMGHYTWWNLHEKSRITAKVAFKSIAVVCETFLFIYLGITSILFLRAGSYNLKWNGWLILFTLILCVFARGVHIFGISACVNKRRKKEITRPMQYVMWFSGLRGAIAFALAMNVPEAYGGNLMQTTTMTVVMVTTLVCGVGTLPLLQRLGIVNQGNKRRSGHEPILLQNDDSSTQDDARMRSPSGTEIDLRITDSTVPYDDGRSGLHKKWSGFDRSVMQKYFGGRYNPKYSNVEPGERDQDEGFLHEAPDTQEKERTGTEEKSSEDDGMGLGIVSDSVDVTIVQPTDVMVNVTEDN